MTLDAGSIRSELAAELDSRGFRAFDAEIEKARAKAARPITQTVKADVDHSSFSRLSGSLSTAKKEASGLAGAIRLIKFPALIAGAGLAAQGIGALAGGAVALTSALGPLTGALAGYPALLGTIGQVAGVKAFAGISNVTSAVGGLNQQIDKSSIYWKRLSPQAQRFAETLDKLQSGPLQSIQKAVQRPLFSGLTKGLEDATKGAGPLRRVLSGTAGVLGHLAERAGALVGSKGFGRDFQKVGETNNRLLSHLGSAGIHLAKALVNVMVVARPLVNWMGKLAEGWAKGAEGAARQGRETGKLAAFFERTQKAMSRVLSIGGSLIHAFGNITKAARPLGNEILKGIDGAAKSFAAWTDSAKGRTSIEDFFQRIRRPLFELGGLAGDLTKGFFQLAETRGLGRLFASLRELVPVFVSLIQTTTKMFTPALIDALKSFLILLGDLAGTSGPLTLLVRALGWVADGLHQIFKASPFVKSATVDLIGFYTIIKAIGLMRGISEFFGFKKGLQGVKGSIAGLKGSFTRLRGWLSDAAFYAKYGASSAADWVSSFGGRMRGGLSRLRSALGNVFSRLGSWLGLSAGERAAEGIAGGEAAGGQAGGLIGSMRTKYLPKLRTFFRERVGRGLGLALVAGMLLALPILVPKAEQFGEKIGAAIRKPIRSVFEGLVNFIIDRLNNIIDAVNAVPLAPNVGHIGGVDFTSGNDTHSSGTPAQNRAARQHAELEQRQLQYFHQHPDARRLPGRLQGRQHGGSVSAGQPYLVGESGPELFVPPTGGQIDPLRALGRQALDFIKRGMLPAKTDVEHGRKDVEDEQDKLEQDHKGRLTRMAKRTDDSFAEMGRSAREKSQRQRQDVGDELDRMNRDHDQVTDAMRRRTSDRFSDMARTAQDRGRDLARYVRGAMGQADSATGTGMQYIADAVGKALQAFDSKDKVHLSVPKPKLTGHRLGGLVKRAFGGRIPGYSAVDDTLIAVRGGERVLRPEDQFPMIDSLVRMATGGMGVDDILQRTGGLGYARGGAVPGMAKGGKSSGGYTFPLSGNFSWGRTDMGVDFAGSPTIRAIGDAQVLKTGAPGWPEGGGVLYRLLGGAPRGFSPSSDVIYNYEGVSPSVHAGQRVSAGDAIARLSGSSMEMGWGLASGAALAAPHYSEGDVTAEGQSFRKFLKALQSGDVAGAERIKRLIVKGTPGPLRGVVQGSLDKMVDAANSYINRKSRVSAGSAAVGRGVLSAAEFIRVALQALRITGHPATQGNAQSLNRLAIPESGRNPKAVNPQAVGGEHASGIMQMLPSTFRAYHEPRTSNSIFDVLANIAASINYQFSRYGGLVTHSPYARGGRVRVPGRQSGGRVGGQILSYLGGLPADPDLDLGQYGAISGRIDNLGDRRKRLRRAMRRVWGHHVDPDHLKTDEPKWLDQLLDARHKLDQPHYGLDEHAFRRQYRHDHHDAHSADVDQAWRKHRDQVHTGLRKSVQKIQHQHPGWHHELRHYRREKGLLDAWSEVQRRFKAFRGIRGDFASRLSNYAGVARSQAGLLGPPRMALGGRVRSAGGAAAGGQVVVAPAPAPEVTFILEGSLADHDVRVRRIVDGRLEEIGQATHRRTQRGGGRRSIYSLG